MAETYIKTVSGGQKTTFSTTDAIPLDDGTTSTYILVSDLYKSNGLVNGKLSVTVSSNDLIVAVKTLAGSDPSTSDPVFIKLDTNIRMITSALSVTAVDGTNWAGRGGTMFAALEQDWFVYLGYNATDGVVIGFSPIPYARKYGDFSTTSTAETYCKISTITNASSNDPYAVVGRFAATLSAGAGYTWTVPTFTPSNLIQEPIYETDWRTWTCAPSQGYSSAPTATVYQYQVRGKNCMLSMREGANGTSNTTAAAVYPIPFTAKTITNGLWFGFAYVVNNSVTDAAGFAYVQSAGTTINFVRSADANYTASGGRRINLQSPFSYPIA